MTCCICDQVIAPADYPYTACWLDPGGEVCVAHDVCADVCLAGLAEYDPNLDTRP